MLHDLPGWIAPIATAIAAMMTAANLGARITGWGFVVFALGSICWTLEGYVTGQTNLLLSNGFLTLVNCAGIWRWLGRQARYEDGTRAATAKSRRASVPTLFSATGIDGMAVSACDGAELGKAVEALVECASGQVSYVVVASGGVAGVDEVLRAVDRGAVKFACDGLSLTIDKAAFEALPVLPTGNWPARAARSEPLIPSAPR